MTRLVTCAVCVRALHPSPWGSFLLLGISIVHCLKPERPPLHRAEFSMLRERAELLAVKHTGYDLIKMRVPGKGTEMHCISHISDLSKYLHVFKCPVVLFNLSKACSAQIWHTAVCVQTHAHLYEQLFLGEQLVLLPWVVVCCCAGLSYEAASHYNAMINYSLRWLSTVIWPLVTRVKPMKDHISSYCVAITHPYNAVGKNLIINSFIQSCL